MTEKTLRKPEPLCINLFLSFSLIGKQNINFKGWVDLKPRIQFSRLQAYKDMVKA